MDITISMIRHAGVRFLVLLLVCSALLFCVDAAGPDNGSWSREKPDLTIANLSVNSSWEHRGYSETPAPVSVFRAELNQSTLPGPRYMGFGPSVIGLDVDPRLLATVFAIVIIGLVIWFVCFRNRREDSGDDRK